jgi:hypothetical protein
MQKSGKFSESHIENEEPESADENSTVKDSSAIDEWAPDFEELKKELNKNDL